MGMVSRAGPFPAGRWLELAGLVLIRGLKHTLKDTETVRSCPNLLQMSSSQSFSKTVPDYPSHCPLVSSVRLVSLDAVEHLAGHSRVEILLKNCVCKLIAVYEDLCLLHRRWSAALLCLTFSNQATFCFDCLCILSFQLPESAACGSAHLSYDV